MYLNSNSAGLEEGLEICIFNKDSKGQLSHTSGALFFAAVTWGGGWSLDCPTLVAKWACIPGIPWHRTNQSLSVKKACLFGNFGLGEGSDLAHNQTPCRGSQGMEADGGHLSSCPHSRSPASPGRSLYSHLAPQFCGCCQVTPLDCLVLKTSRANVCSPTGLCLFADFKSCCQRTWLPTSLNVRTD